MRVAGYDYARPGAYFVTICTHGKALLFGDVVDGKMWLNGCGEVAREEWIGSVARRREIALDAFVVMPNHLHAIIWLRAPSLEPPPAAPGARRAPRRAPQSLGSLIAGFKAAVTRRVRGRLPIWQRNYYEHIIRNDGDLTRIRQYIADNPARWTSDREHPHPS